jgi:hypothetical protein
MKYQSSIPVFVFFLTVSDTPTGCLTLKIPAEQVIDETPEQHSCFS